MAVGDAYVLPGFLTPVLTQFFFPKPPTTFLTCFCRGERRKYAGKKSSLNRGSNSQPPVMSPTRLPLSHPCGARLSLLSCRSSGNSMDRHNLFFLRFYSMLVNPFPKKPWFLCVCSTSLLKTLWEKEKLLVTINFSFSFSVFLLFLRTFCHFYQI